MNGSVPISPTECTAGTYSPPGVGICHACPLGTYSRTGASFCSPCPAGHSCDDPSQSPVACTSSEYWNNGGEVMAIVLLCEPLICTYNAACDTSSAWFTVTLLWEA